MCFSYFVLRVLLYTLSAVLCATVHRWSAPFLSRVSSIDCKRGGRGGGGWVGGWRGVEDGGWALTHQSHNGGYCTLRSPLMHHHRLYPRAISLAFNNLTRHMRRSLQFIIPTDPIKMCTGQIKIPKNPYKNLNPYNLN